jgi:hypothetical protein
LRCCRVPRSPRPPPPRAPHGGGAQGHRQPGLPADVDDQADVLEVLREPGIRRELTTDHALALGVHDSRIRGAAPHDLEGQCQIETGRFSEGQPFGQRGPVQTQHEVGHQLHLCAGPRGTCVECLGPNQRKNVGARRERIGVASNHERRRARPHLRAAARDRCVQIADSLFTQDLRQLFGTGRIPGRRIDDRQTAAERCAGGPHDVADFAMARQAQQHRGTTGEHLLCIARDFTSVFPQRGAAPGIDVPADDTQTGSEQPIRQRAAHESKADQADRWMRHLVLTFRIAQESPVSLKVPVESGWLTTARMHVGTRVIDLPDLHERVADRLTRGRQHAAGQVCDLSHRRRDAWPPGNRDQPALDRREVIACAGTFWESRSDG